MMSSHLAKVQKTGLVIKAFTIKKTLAEHNAQSRSSRVDCQNLVQKVPELTELDFSYSLSQKSKSSIHIFFCSVYMSMGLILETDQFV